MVRVRASMFGLYGGARTADLTARGRSEKVLTPGRESRGNADLRRCGRLHVRRPGARAPAGGHPDEVAPPGGLPADLDGPDGRPGGDTAVDLAGPVDLS